KLGLILVGAQEEIPPGKVEAEVAVCFPPQGGMVDPVHVRSDQHQAQQPVQPAGQAQVAVVEHGGGVEQYFKDEYGQGGGAQKDHNRQFDAPGKQDFQGVEAQPGRHIEIQVGMVDQMKPPEERHGME